VLIAATAFGGLTAGAYAIESPIQDAVRQAAPGANGPKYEDPVPAAEPVSAAQLWDAYGEAASCYEANGYRMTGPIPTAGGANVRYDLTLPAEPPFDTGEDFDPCNKDLLSFSMRFDDDENERERSILASARHDIIECVVTAAPKLHREYTGIDASTARALLERGESTPEISAQLDDYFIGAGQSDNAVVRDCVLAVEVAR
jgi:hypothetical protein